MMDEDTSDLDIDRYLITGWEKHVFSFSVAVTRKHLTTYALHDDDDNLSTWKVFVKSSVSNLKKKQKQTKKRKNGKFVICSELFSSPRECVFVKFFYSLITLDKGEVLMRRGRKCCARVGRKMEYHMHNIQCHSTKNMVLNITVVSETADIAGLVDLMKTVQEIQSSSRIPVLQHQDCDADIKPEIDANGDVVHSNDAGEGQAQSEISRDALRRETPQSFREYDYLWEKVSFTFDVVCGETPCINLSKKQTSLALCKWDVTGKAEGFEDLVVLSVNTKLCASPRKVSFVKFLFNISTVEGKTLQNFEVKRCYRVFAQHTCQLRSIPKESGDIILNVVIMSDTIDNDELNQTITDNNSVVDLADSDDDDDIHIVKSHSKEGSVNGMPISDIRIKEENTDSEFSTNLPDGLRDDNSDCVTSWESCIYNYSISAGKEEYSVRCMKHYYQPSDASNKWHLTASVCNEENGDHDTSCISLKLTLKSSSMEKVLVKLISYVNTTDGIKVFREKYCLNVRESLVHTLRNIHLSSENSLKIVILSETPGDSIDSGQFFGDIEDASSETDLASEYQQIGNADTAIIKTKELRLITDISRLVEISPVIGNMLKHSAEGRERAQIQMTEFSSVAICQLLTYANGSESLELGSKSATELLQLSVRYGIDTLKEVCESYLVSTLNEANAMNLLLLADSFATTKLKQKAVRFICKNPEIFAQNSGYDELTNRPDLLKEILIGVTNKSATKRKKSTEKKTLKKDKKDHFMRNLEDEYMTSEQNDDDPEA